MTELTLTAKNPARLSADVLVLGIADDGDHTRILGADHLSSAAAKTLASTVSLLSVSGAAGEVTRVPAVEGIKADTIALTGLGALPEGEQPSAEQLRRGAGAAVRELAKAKSIALALPAADAAMVGAITEGA
ncbi:MAG TPA: M17 family peptidase N-terminal domain-containing protein, partial [Beutenbergiaceae bacterium]|nr:M17 family peptidase N-terminal domain-containing protein [Beutenbergiaceae bacterium]